MFRSVSTDLDRLMTEERDRRMKHVAQTREAFINAVSMQGSVRAKYTEICNAAVRELNAWERVSAAPPMQFHGTCDAMQQQIFDGAAAKFNKPTPKEWVSARVREWTELKVREVFRCDYGHWRSVGTINNPDQNFVEDYWFPEGKVEGSPALNEAVAFWVDEICKDVLK